MGRFKNFVNNKDKQYFILYQGRFQPFHAGHYEIYEYLVKRFGADNVHIGTSDKKTDKDSPFTFNEKKKIIKTFNIPDNKIIKVKNPYFPSEILDNKQDVVFVSVIGNKDKTRIKKISAYKNFDEEEEHLTVADKVLYYIIAPKNKKVKLSGTEVRNLLSTEDKEKAKKQFTKIYNSNDEKLFELLYNKIRAQK